MPKYDVSLKDYKVEQVDGKRRKLLSREAWDRFDASLLGLGDLTKPSVPTEAIAAVFDLEGFTNFCKQIDPHLSVPSFLNEFLAWLIARLRAEVTAEQYDSGVFLYSPLPFFLKFMGDGVLVLWDASGMATIPQRNVLLSAHQICDQYALAFHPRISKKVADSPPQLRCGVARGTVYSVGDGDDFVGSCINMAARLQKLPGIRFAFNCRGFNLDEEGVVPFFQDDIVVKRVSVRGIGDNELVGIRKSEFESLSAGDCVFRTHLNTDSGAT